VGRKLCFPVIWNDWKRRHVEGSKEGKEEEKERKCAWVFGERGGRETRPRHGRKGNRVVASFTERNPACLMPGRGSWNYFREKSSTSCQTQKPDVIRAKGGVERKNQEQNLGGTKTRLMQEICVKKSSRRKKNSFPVPESGRGKTLPRKTTN